ncbi:hypothetical protein C8N33_112124, partial [Pararhodobacter aggregans]
MMRNSLARTDLAFVLHPQTDPALLEVEGPMILDHG